MNRVQNFIEKENMRRVQTLTIRNGRQCLILSIYHNNKNKIK